MDKQFKVVVIGILGLLIVAVLAIVIGGAIDDEGDLRLKVFFDDPGRLVKGSSVFYEIDKNSPTQRIGQVINILPPSGGQTAVHVRIEAAKKDLVRAGSRFVLSASPASIVVYTPLKELASAPFPLCQCK